MKKDYYLKVILFIMFALLAACKKEEKKVPPSVDTASVDEIYNTAARVGGRVTSNGGAEITERGVYWGTSASPETKGTKLPVGTGTGSFYETLSGLTSGMKYYVTAYAVNSIGTSFGNETFFTTQINLPTVETSAVTEYTSTTAKIGGSVINNGGFEVSQRGVYWGVKPNPRLTGTKLELGTGDGAFSRTVTGLSRSFTYYVIAYATNLKGTSWGSEINFSTQPEVARVITTTISNITGYSARIGGTISSDGGTAITEKGIYWGTSATPLTGGTKVAMGSGSGDFSDSLASLNPGTKYYIMAYAVNSIGASYGEIKSFTTLGNIPEVRNLAYTGLSATGITLKGLVSSNDLSTIVVFEYGTTTTYGQTIVPAKSPVSGNNDTVAVNITGLVPLTLYHSRIKATNDMGTVYSNDLTYTTVITGIAGTVSDFEGNSYKTIGIGYQQWMTENLRAVKYNNGTAVPPVKNDSIWAQLSGPGYCWYAKDSLAGYMSYGALYNWYTINNGQLCPTGWHVPSNDDITILVNYLGGAGEAGGILKETGTAHWNSPNTGATNKYGFTALAGGKRLADGSFDFMKVEANWWSSTEYSTINSSNLTIQFNYSNSFQAYTNKKIGMSVRCVKD
jgi:uncharacterized protein (TIGR02145 family)